MSGRASTVRLLAATLALAAGAAASTVAALLMQHAL
jgi:hypothetical protein